MASAVLSLFFKRTQRSRSLGAEFAEGIAPVRSCAARMEGVDGGRRMLMVELVLFGEAQLCSDGVADHGERNPCPDEKSVACHQSASVIDGKEGAP